MGVIKGVSARWLTVSKQCTHHGGIKGAPDRVLSKERVLNRTTLFRCHIRVFTFS